MGTPFSACTPSRRGLRVTFMTCQLGPRTAAHELCPVDTNTTLRRECPICVTFPTASLRRASVRGRGAQDPGASRLQLPVKPCRRELARVHTDTRKDDHCGEGGCGTRSVPANVGILI